MKKSTTPKKTGSLNLTKLASLLASAAAIASGYLASAFFFAGIDTPYSDMPRVKLFYLTVGLIGAVFGAGFKATDDKGNTSFAARLFYALGGFFLLGVAIWLRGHLFDFTLPGTPGILLLFIGVIVALVGQLVGACLRGITKFTWRWLHS